MHITAYSCFFLVYYCQIMRGWGRGPAATPSSTSAFGDGDDEGDDDENHKHDEDGDGHGGGDDHLCIIAHAAVWQLSETSR